MSSISSVVTDVLNSAGILAKEDISSKVEILRKKVDDVKLEVQENLKSRYIDFVPKYVRLDKLVNSLRESKEEFETLFYHVEKEIKPQMDNSVSEYQELFDELKKIKALKHIVYNLAEMHKNLESSRSAVDQKLYLMATEQLLQFDNAAKEIGLNERKDIEVYCAMKTKYCVAKENAIYRLGEEWNRRVVFHFTEKSVTQLQKAELAINLVNSDEFLEVVNSLELLNQLERKLKSFGKQFINLICEPLICKNIEMFIVTTNDVMKITVSTLDDSHPQPVTVCSNMEKLFKRLNDSLFGWTIERSNSILDSTKPTLMHKFGECVSQELCKTLVEKSLKPSVPSQSQEAKMFQQCVVCVRDLLNFFYEIHFLCEEGNMIHDFIGNADHLLANKMSMDLLSRARDLMKQGLHQTVVVGEKESPENEQSSATSPTEELQQVSKMKNGLSKNTFAFPACQVSVSAKQLVKLLHQVLEEANNLDTGGLVYATKLFYTARGICELYCCVVPTHHKEQITNIPQQTAIFHNNCMYIAHCLLTLGQAHKRVNLSCPVTFVDLVPELRRIGTEAFLAQMRTQRQNLLQLLQDPGAFQNMAQDEDLVNKAEKIVRQCLCQMELLKRVWADVLPTEVYFKAIGTLLNTFLEEIIILVTAMEDIAAQVASHLDSIFDIVMRQSPELFKVEHDDKRDLVHRYVRKWFKFQELQKVLGASLLEIVDRWASGKGPLAAHFTADETKHLIRALFQNTERRAAALGKIR